MNHKNENINKCERSACGMLVTCGDSVPENEGREPFTKPKFTSETLTKAQAFWQRQSIKRKSPGNCSRCGKPNNNGKQRCDRCRAYHSTYKRRRAVESMPQIVLDSEKHAKLVKRIESLELAIAALQLKDRQMYKRGFNKGFKAAERIANRPSTYEPPTISIQELATMNHAYENQRAEM